MAQPYLQVNERAQENTALITGIVNYNWETDGVEQSIVGASARQMPLIPTINISHNRFSKHHLLPVGFVPLKKLPARSLVRPPMSSFSRGDYQQANLKLMAFTLARYVLRLRFLTKWWQMYMNTDMIITVEWCVFGHSYCLLSICRLRKCAPLS